MCISKIKQLSLGRVWIPSGVRVGDFNQHLAFQTHSPEHSQSDKANNHIRI